MPPVAFMAFLSPTNTRTPALRAMDSALEEAARTCGSGLSGMLFKIVVPLMLPTLLVVLLLGFIRSMQAEVPNHEPSLMLMNCGEARQSRPSMGAWITYGLGSENQNLPGFIAMCPGGYPIVSTQNWRAAFLPGAYQGTYINTQHTEVSQLIANIRNGRMSPEQQREQLLAHDDWAHWDHNRQRQ